MQTYQIRYAKEDQEVHVFYMELTNAECWKDLPFRLAAAHLFINGYKPGRPWCIYWCSDNRAARREACTWEPLSYYRHPAAKEWMRKNKEDTCYGNCTALSLVHPYFVVR